MILSFEPNRNNEKIIDHVVVSSERNSVKDDIMQEHRSILAFPISIIFIFSSSSLPVLTQSFNRHITLSSNDRQTGVRFAFCIFS